MFHVERDGNEFTDTLSAASAALSIEIDHRSFHLFERYFYELQKWNQAINLTAIHDQKEVIIKHFVDSLAGLKQLEISSNTLILDVGAGAGFPSIPLKLVRPRSCTTLVEPNQKKVAFLRYLIGALNIPMAKVVSETLECYAVRPEVQGLFDYIVVRAFKVSHLGEMLAGLLKEEGKLVLYRATKVERDFNIQGLALMQEVEYELPAGYGHRILSTFTRQ